jgi:hypothetical protein
MEKLEQITITQDHLKQIENLAPDGGDDIYSLVFPNWSGTEEELYIASFADVALLKNIRYFWVNAVAKESSLELSHLLHLQHLETLDTDWFYVDEGNNPQEVIAALMDRGVSVAIAGTPSQG